MGGHISKRSNGRSKKKSTYYGGSGSSSGNYQQQQNEPVNKVAQAAATVGEKNVEILSESRGGEGINNNGYESASDDEFYDGIPRFSRNRSQKSRSFRSKQAAVAKVRRASSFGLGKAVNVLDTLGSSMTSLNSSAGFVTGATTKSNELSILSFEVANTIVKGQSLMISLSKRSIRQLTERVLLSEGIQHLVSKDMDQLLTIVAADKREELKLFAGEVVRFGNRCKDPQWHNLDLYFEKHSKEPPKPKEDVDSIMQQLMTVVQHTAELYHELHLLDTLEQDQLLLKYQLTDITNSRSDRKGDIKSRRKQVKTLKKKSLWSRSMEEVMGKLVDIVLFLNREIQNAFATADCNTTSNGSISIQQRLGPAGLSLHYANIVLQIDALVARSSAMPPDSRDTLYQSLPPNMKSSLRSKLHSFHVKEEFTVTEIKAEMEKTLHWLVPIATNTAKAHHGFGWVGEWGSSGSEANRRSTTVSDIIRIDTLHYADREKTEAYITELVLWLNHLINKSKCTKANGGGASVKSPISSPATQTNQNQQEQPKVESAATTAISPAISVEGYQESSAACKSIQGLEPVEQELMNEMLSQSNDHGLKM